MAKQPIASSQNFQWRSMPSRKTSDPASEQPVLSSSQPTA
jgi:hypothetical protein